MCVMNAFVFPADFFSANDFQYFIRLDHFQKIVFFSLFSNFNQTQISIKHNCSSTTMALVLNKPRISHKDIFTQIHKGLKICNSTDELKNLP